MQRPYHRNMVLKRQYQALNIFSCLTVTSSLPRGKGNTVVKSWYVLQEFRTGNGHAHDVEGIQ